MACFIGDIYMVSWFWAVTGTIFVQVRYRCKVKHLQIQEVASVGDGTAQDLVHF